METGTIANLNEKHFGFISREGEDKDLFFHANELNGVEFDSLNVGDKVQFEVGQSDKGPNAVNVSLAGDAAASDDAASDDSSEEEAA